MIFAQTSAEKSILDARKLKIAREAQTRDGSLQLVARELGFDSEEQALAAVGATLGMDIVDLAKTKIDLGALGSFPIKLIHRHLVFPLEADGDSLRLAIGNPFDLHALDAVGAATGRSVVPVVALPAELAKLIKTHLGVGAETVEGLLAQTEDRDSGVEVLDDIEWDHSEAAEMAQEASVVRLVNEILTEAVENRASDIHIEAQEEGMKVRYRIDGVLQKQPMPPEINRFQSAIISRLKIMARLNIAEKRVPQDGRIKLKVQGREIDIRVSIIPMLHGEGVVMRVLDKDRMSFSLRGIGMDEDIYAEFGKLISLPHGIILVTGPTGSGKTTTLYSALNEIKSEDTKIITTEDPIEYQLNGINQIQVHTKVGLTFAASLRAILRHDPDVVLVGEIRDLETAENAVQASLTGHLVFSTLHTNDAAGAFMRLADMGVEPFLVCSTVEGVMAQRLVRTLCKECRQETIPSQKDVPDDFPFDECMETAGHVYAPTGCRACRGTGYSGRVGIYELLVANDEVRALASERAPTNLVKQAAIRGGMRTLRQDGWRKVIQGRTTIDEVLRVTKAD
ncbi:MAG: type II secretion system ATPase GspE [Pirellulales bacterium]|jgi:general secretion pathway protein E/type IV pilus assembly protein PilB|nr:type II secretion system ATPase GspE [Thermoguttaceae bacterium]MDD4786236.1 type II secretion system ATPase GspE [Pirellulales bacterium]NLZ00457.1 type II secretion system ATPase GspE [Pirellulaceae bacterium]